VCGRMGRVAFSTCDTVAIETPARAATSLILDANLPPRSAPSNALDDKASRDLCMSG
jgi:hypothetical protein